MSKRDWVLVRMKVPKEDYPINIDFMFRYLKAKGLPSHIGIGAWHIWEDIPENLWFVYTEEFDTRLYREKEAGLANKLKEAYERGDIVEIPNGIAYKIFKEFYKEKKKQIQDVSKLLKQAMEILKK